MALKPIPPRPGVPGDEERYQRDLEHCNANPQSWANPDKKREAEKQEKPLEQEKQEQAEVIQEEPPKSRRAAKSK